MAFMHPSIGGNTADHIDHVVAKVAATENPWYAGFQKMSSGAAAMKCRPVSGVRSAIDMATSGTYIPAPVPIIYDETTARPTAEADYMHRWLDDAQASVVQVWMYAFTGNTDHLDNAISIFNAWSSTLTAIEGKTSTLNNPSAPGATQQVKLYAGWTTPSWCQSMEMLEYLAPGYMDPGDQLDFYDMLEDIVLPQLDWSDWGNWNMSFAESQIAIGVLLEDEDIFNNGCNYWLDRVPNKVWSTGDSVSKGYMRPAKDPPYPQVGGVQYSSQGVDTPGELATKWYHTSYAALTVALFNGHDAEVGRDLSHGAMGMGSALKAAETGYWNGRPDLYSNMEDAFVNGWEQFAAWDKELIRIKALAGFPAGASGNASMDFATATTPTNPVGRYNPSTGAADGTGRPWSFTARRAIWAGVAVDAGGWVLFYRHYHGRRGYTLANTEDLLFGWTDGASSYGNLFGSPGGSGGAGPVGLSNQFVFPVFDHDETSETPITVDIPSGAAAWSWGSSGLEDLDVVKDLPQSTAGWSWGTSGGIKIIRSIEEGAAAWSWTTLSGTDLVRKELLAGSGVTAQVWDRANYFDDEEGLLALIQYSSLKFEDEVSGPGSAELVLSRDYLGASWMAKDNIIKFIVEGVERFAMYIEEVLEIPIAEDETQTVRIVGRGVGKALEWGVVAPLDGDTLRSWPLATRGKILYDLLQEIQARGTLTQVTRNGWNDLVNSLGELWNELLSIEFYAGGNYLSLLNDWGEYGIEWHLDSQFKLALAPELGKDLSEDIHLFPLNTVKGQENTFTRRDLKTVLFAEDGNKGVSILEDAAAIAEWDRREQYAVFSDAVNEGSRTAQGYALLNLIKDQITERRVKIDPMAPGRRPFVDFGLGDRVSVWFGTSRFSFRVLAIAFSVDENNRISAEVTLDFILEAQRRRRQKLLEGSGGGGSAGTSTQLLEKTEAAGAVVDASGVDLCALSLLAYRTTYGIVGISIDGVASQAMILTIDLMYGDDIAKTFHHKIDGAGADSGGWPWAWTQIPEGVETLRLRVRTSVGYFTIGPSQIQLYVQANGIAGNTSGTAPRAYVTEDVTYNPIPGELVEVTFPEYASGGYIDLVEEIAYRPEPEEVIDTVFILDYSVDASGDDGYSTATPLFSDNGTFSVAGNQSGVSAIAWYRFSIPSALDLTGKVIRDARLIGVADVTMTGAQSVVAAELSSDPVAPVDRADLLGKSLTTAEVNWDGNSTSGATVTSSNLASVIQELVDTYGDLDHIQIIHDDRSSPVDGRWALRTQDHLTSPAVRLVITYEP